MSAAVMIVLEAIQLQRRVPFACLGQRHFSFNLLFPFNVIPVGHVAIQTFIPIGLIEHDIEMFGSVDVGTSGVQPLHSDNC